MGEVHMSDIFSRVIYPFCLRKCLSPFMRNPGRYNKKYKDPLDPAPDPPSSSFIDAIVFNPEIYKNARTVVLSPVNYFLPFEVVHIDTKDGLTLMGFLILQQRVNYTTLPTIIVFHGNSGNIGDRLEMSRKLFRDLKCNILLIEYRGYGFSEGYASERGVYYDAQAAFDFVDRRQDLDSSQIVVFGKSLGGAIVIDLASRKNYRHRIAAVVIENTFSSLNELARHILPKCFVPLIKICRLSRKFPNYQKVSLIVRPTLFISSLNDTFIEPVHMTKLFYECKATRKQIIRFPKADHLDAWTKKDYTKLFNEFLTETFKNFPVHQMVPVYRQSLTDS